MIGVVGAGRVGAACALALVTRGAACEVVIVDGTRARAKAVVTDLRYGVPPCPEVTLRHGDYADLAGAGIVLITAESILDPSFEFTPSLDTDIQRTFARVWRELGEREEPEEESGADRDSLWLECNGELVDAGSGKIIGVRMPALLAELVEFVCPRCHQRHESLRFR